ncbi:DUF4174 domain-containing protein [Roseovarius sp. C7]|uniref:DUF4174 domain-containing protein n=1 Tax=Roseovarius sp. C7 TaxID=3398643 RepID=UPI0039F4DD9E
MTRVLSKFSGLLLAISLIAPATAQEATDPELDPVVLGSVDANLNDFLWHKRPLVIFADSPGDPRFLQQMQYIEARLDDLAERDVVVLIDTDPTLTSDLREALRPRGFMLALISKDGTVILRKPSPWSVREISRTIDKQPLREQEIRDRRAAGQG